jgi:hypothetical protein
MSVSRESDRVRPEIHLASAIPNRKRRSFARADDQVVVPFKQERECKRSSQTRQRSPHRVDWRASFRQLLICEMSDHLLPHPGRPMTRRLRRQPLFGDGIPWSPPAPFALSPTRTAEAACPQEDPRDRSVKSRTSRALSGC